jgi:hypothetical protein
MWIKECYIWYNIRTFVNVTMYYHLAQQFKKKSKKKVKRS